MDMDRKFVQSLGCQWLGPDYDPRTHRGATPYCGCKSLVGDSLYCEEHYPRMYVKGSALRKRHKDLKRKQQIEELRQLFYDLAEELEDEGWEPGVDWREPALD